MNTAEKIVYSYETLRKITDFTPDIALVLGSGLSDGLSDLKVLYDIPFSEIGIPVSTVIEHKSHLLLGTLNNVKLALFNGRIHYYEGVDIADTVLPVRLSKLMGAKACILTNAVGAINKKFGVGDFMLINDHITSFMPSPLRGENVSFLGERFPDMSNVYDADLKKAVKDSAKELGILLREGIYVQLPGPNLETPAEINMCRILGADAVGMSTATEAMAAHHCSLKTVGISFISNMACGISDSPLSYEEVITNGELAKPKFSALITEVIKKIYSILV